MRRFAAIALFVLACSPGAKHDDGSTIPVHEPDLPPSAPGAKVVMTTAGGDVAVNVEVVATEAKVERGLMYREHLPPDDGMLFMMGSERDWEFYMKNTLIPLDMVFITKDMTIAGIVENAEPRTLTLRKCGATSLYVLELNGGFAAAHHLAAGGKVRFDGVK